MFSSFRFNQMLSLYVFKPNTFPYVFPYELSRCFQTCSGQKMRMCLLGNKDEKKCYKHLQQYNGKCYCPVYPLLYSLCLSCVFSGGGIASQI